MPKADRLLLGRGLVLALGVILFGGTLTGTVRDQRVIERQDLALAVGFDKGEKGTLRVISTFPQVAREAEEKEEIIAVDALSSKDARIRLETKSGRRVASGQIRVALFSDALARSGLKPFIDTLYRDPDINARLFLAVVDGSTETLLSRRYPEKERSGFYLYNLLETNMRRHTIPTGRLHHFLRAYYTFGQDPVLPLLRPERENVAVAGAALFRGSRMVGRLDLEESGVLLLLKGSASGADSSMRIRLRDKTGTLVFIFVQNERRIRAEPSGPRLRFHISLAITAHLVEYAGQRIGSLSNPAVKRAIERAVAHRYKEKAEAVLRKLQQLGTDPIGLGTYARAHKLWNGTEKEWYRIYRKLPISVDVSFRITQVGLYD
ncbi:Ger(x)C family spore germination protein [Calditerricola satsumensis]|uniref:Germination protein XA n=1 Tax=Calditerricola satsumensis TaxID=373054 RepID=A0A8J3BAL7_9BACI|nr:Ger(x)C family spore germination protein [Calditerricola satsumensis]GGJ93390.1 germination protein XA [Calditerricola satsumensis]